MTEKDKELNNLEETIPNFNEYKENESNNFNEAVRSNINEYLQISKYFYGGFGIRFFAMIIDLLIIGAFTKLINAFTFGKLDFGYKIPVLNDTLLYIITYHLYFFIFTYFFSQTIGKMIVGIRVEKNNGEKLTLGDTFFREVVGRFLNYALVYILYLIVPFNDKKKGIHDYIADSVVVKTDFSLLRKKINLALKNTK